MKERDNWSQAKTRASNGGRKTIKKENDLFMSSEDEGQESFLTNNNKNFLPKKHINWEIREPNKITYS